MNSLFKISSLFNHWVWTMGGLDTTRSPKQFLDPQILYALIAKADRCATLKPLLGQ